LSKLIDGILNRLNVIFLQHNLKGRLNGVSFSPIFSQAEISKEAQQLLNQFGTLGSELNNSMMIRRDVIQS
jgi:hypothetical protein